MTRRRVFLGLNPTELKALEEFLSECAVQGKARARLRGNAVYFSNQGMNVPEIAQQLRCSPRSVYAWLRRYREKGMAGLLGLRGSIKLTPEQIDQLMEVSHWSAAGAKRRRKEFRARWSFRQMAQWVKDERRVKLSHEQIRRMVRQKLGQKLKELPEVK